MIILTREEIDSLEHLKRVNLINSISGYKSANLIGSADNKGVNNLAVFSSVTHFGSNPPILGMVTRPTSVARHTYDNIKEMGFYTINHIHEDFIEHAHQTSAKYEDGISEFTECGLSPMYGAMHKAPYVVESNIGIGMKFLEEYHIKANGTILILGEIVEIMMSKNYINEEGDLDLNMAGTVAISGLNHYHKPNNIGSFPYARPKK